MFDTVMAATLITLAPVNAVLAERQPTTVEAAVAIADGKAWSMVTRDGKRASLALTPDGRGQLTGPVSVSVRWRVEQRRFCLHMGFLLGTRCVALVAIQNGWRGIGPKGDAFTLTRS